MLPNPRSENREPIKKSEELDLLVKLKPEIPVKPINLPSNRFIVRNTLGKNIMNNENPKTTFCIPKCNELLALPHSSSPVRLNECCGIILPSGISQGKFENKSDRNYRLLTSDNRRSNKSIHEQEQYKQSSKHLEYLLTQNFERNEMKNPFEKLKTSNQAILTNATNDQENQQIFNDIHYTNRLSSELRNEIHQQLKSIQDKLSVEKHLPQCCMLKTLENDGKTDSNNDSQHKCNSNILTNHVSFYKFLINFNIKFFHYFNTAEQNICICIFY